MTTIRPSDFKTFDEFLEIYPTIENDIAGLEGENLRDFDFDISARILLNDRVVEVGPIESLPGSVFFRNNLTSFHGHVMPEDLITLLKNNSQTLQTFTVRLFVGFNVLDFPDKIKYIMSLPLPSLQEGVIQYDPLVHRLVGEDIVLDDQVETVNGYFQESPGVLVKRSDL